MVVAPLSSCPAISAPRRTGEVSIRSITPRSMSAMNVVPAQPLDISAVIITMPGVRNAMYDESLNPGSCTTPLNNCPNSSNQIAGCTKVKAINAGDRYCARSHSRRSSPSGRQSAGAGR